MAAIITITECGDDIDVKVSMKEATEEERYMALNMIGAYAHARGLTNDDIEVKNIAYNNREEMQ